MALKPRENSVLVDAAPGQVAPAFFKATVIAVGPEVPRDINPGSQVWIHSDNLKKVAGAPPTQSIVSSYNIEALEQ